MKRFICGNKENWMRDGFIWNTAGGILNAFQSVIILVVISRTLPIDDSGVFTIAWAVANLMVTIGKYGVRNYQATDIREKYSFGDYWIHRILCAAAMLLASAGYVAYLSIQNNYSAVKSSVILLMCYLKLIEAVEDVFHGMYQQKDRLDIAGRCLTVRQAVSIIALCAALLVTKNLLISSVICAVVTTAAFVYLTVISLEEFSPVNWKRGRKAVSGIFRECFFIFAGSFLSLYILNAPKYAIDATLGADIQAYYGYISMPVFVVGLLNNFIFQPLLTRMTLAFETDIAKFRKLFVSQIAVIILLTAGCMAAAYLLGIPVLSLLYNCDLSPYRTDLCIMMLGGGSLALGGFLTTILTLIRKQDLIVLGYGIGGLLALFFSNRIVGLYGIRGASMLYLALTTIMWILFLFSFLISAHNKLAKPKK